MESLEKKFTDDKCVKEKEINKKIKNLEGLIKKQTKKNTVYFSCTSSQGLRTHIKMKNTKLNTEKYPTKCEICETELDDKQVLNLHMKTHPH